MLNQTPDMCDPNSHVLLIETGTIRAYADIMHIAVIRSFNEICYRANYAIFDEIIVQVF